MYVGKALLVTKIIQCIMMLRIGQSSREEEILPLLKSIHKMKGQLNVKQMAHCENKGFPFGRGLKILHLQQEEFPKTV